MRGHTGGHTRGLLCAWEEGEGHAGGLKTSSLVV